MDRQVTPDVIRSAKFNIVTKAMTVKTGDDGRQSLRCTASSTVEDLHGDSMTDECVRDMAAQAKAKAMTIFLNHRYNVPEDVFGVTTDSAVASRAHEKDGTAIWDMDLQIDLAGTNPRVPQTYSLIAQDQVKLGVSIGAMIEEWDFKDEKQGFWGGLIIKKVNLLEASIVGIPANQRSWVQNAVRAIKAAYREAAEDDMDADDTIEQPPVTLDASRAAIVASAATAAAIAATAPTDTKTAEGTPAAAPEPPATPDATPTPPATPEPAPGGTEAGTESTSADGGSSGDTSVEAPVVEASAATTEGAPSGPVANAAESSLLTTMAAALESATIALASNQVELESLRSQVKTLTGERDQAVKLAEAAAEVIEKIATTPLGRKTVIREAASDFQSVVRSVYGDAAAALVGDA